MAKTLKATFPKAEVLKLDVEQENGVTVYDFEFKDGETKKETDIAADGTMLEFTVVVADSVVPAPAMNAIRAAAKGAKIERIEHIEISYETKDGKVLKLPELVPHYAADLAKGRQTAEIAVAPDGGLVEAAKWTNAKDVKPEGKTGK